MPTVIVQLVNHRKRLMETVVVVGCWPRSPPQPRRLPEEADGNGGGCRLSQTMTRLQRLMADRKRLMETVVVVGLGADADHLGIEYRKRLMETVVVVGSDNARPRGGRLPSGRG